MHHEINRPKLRVGLLSTHHKTAVGWDAFYRDVSAWVRAGRMKDREGVVDGLEHAPEAFIRSPQGRNFGKLLVRVSE